MPRKAGRAYQTFKAKVRTIHASHGLPCALCREPIDYRLGYPHPRSWSLDHRVALHQGGAEFDPANTQPSHLRCNQSRGASESNAKRSKRRTGAPSHTSWRW